MPVPGVPAVAGAAFVDVEAGVGVGDDAGVLGAATGALEELAAEGVGVDRVAAGGGAALAAAGALPILTSGVILLIVAAGTPAFDKSLTEEYGRPAMIFFAVASPTPGKASNCAALALFRSTGASLAPAALGFAAAVDLLAADLAEVGAGAGDA